LTAKRFGKQLLKITGIITGLLVLLLVGFHFWFKAHAKEMIEELVSSKSKGKIKLKIEKIHFNYFNRKIELKKAVFYNTDTLTGTTAYHFSVDKMQLRVKAILPIVFRNEIVIDSLNLLNPRIEVTRLREAIKSGKRVKKDVSIPEEMGKVYASIQDGLKILKVKRFQINDGTFTLNNKIDPGQLPLTVSNIHFYIENTDAGIGSNAPTGKNPFTKLLFGRENKKLKFPDGRHRFSFIRFRINLKNKMVALDSCTIAATRSENSAAAFKVFFDALVLTNIDFDTLYKAEVIKADSVYCVNPTFDLDVEIGKKKGNKKPAPKLEDIIKQLTGDLQLGYVVVSNAGFNIKTVKNNVPNTFTFSNNNFEMQGLHVDQEAAKPVTVKSFVMAIRNYENFIKDSSYSVKFDSVLFKDDRITLSNFLFNKLDHGKILNTFSIPEFSLRGLSWDDLVFERNLKAEHAIMLNPHISYTSSGRKKKNIFQSLGAINEFMDLQQLDIVDGTIDLKLRNNLRVQLDNATLSVKSQSLLESKKLAGIKKSLTRLQFRNGIIHAGNLDMELHELVYTGESGQFGAGRILLKNKEKNLLVDLRDVTGNKMQVDEISGNVYGEGVRWAKADISINLAGAGKKEGQSTVELKDVTGSNTSLKGHIGGKAVSTKLNNIFFTRLEKKPGSQLVLEGLAVSGQDLALNDNSMDLKVKSYTMTDRKSSSFRGISYSSSGKSNHTVVAVPLLTLTPYIRQLLDGDISLDAVHMTNPVITIQQAKQNTAEIKGKSGLPDMNIGELFLNQPAINYTRATDSGSVNWEWHGERTRSDFLKAGNLHTHAGKTSLDDLSFYLTDFAWSGPGGKKFNSGEGKVTGQLKDIQLVQDDNQHLAWSGTITQLGTRDFRLDSIGKAKGTLVLNSGSVENLTISSSTITRLQQLASANRFFKLKKLSGHYADSGTTLDWANAGFDRNSNTFSLDSFSVTPALSRDSFLARQSFQKDYISLRSGAVSIGPLDIEQFIRDGTLNGGMAVIDHFVITDYKDKRLPFNSGIIKLMPVNSLKMIRQQLKIDTVLLTNATVEYTEFNEKTKKAGTIPVNRMTVRLLSVKNYDIKPGDSLQIQASGYLMDTAWIRLRVRESYTDSLGGFLMTLRMKPADIKVLNPVLIPLASLKIESGMLDTISLRAAGNEYLAAGEINMFYRDLKVRFLKDGDETRKTFQTRLMNFIANTFIIHSNNRSRTGNAFFIRDRSRSAINYLIKIGMSGISSSVGAKNNKKLIRRHQKELDQNQLPAIDLN